MNPFHPKELFSIKDSLFSRFFDSYNYVWELIPNIHPFLMTLPLGHIDSPIPDGVFLENIELITIEPGCVIEKGAFIRGPCYLSRGTEVRHGAYIRGDLITGEKVVIGHTTEVKNALFLANSKAAHFSYVGDSILGYNVNLGAGTKCANLKFDHSPVQIKYKNQSYPTGLKKMGAVFGDNSQTGCNSVTNPGTIFFKNSQSLPCTNVFGVVLENHRYLKKGDQLRTL